jgi:hypothetical protein
MKINTNTNTDTDTDTDTAAQDDQPTVTITDIRRALLTHLRSESPCPRADLIAAVTNDLPVDADVVDGQLDKAEREGLIYIVNGRVKLP